jgi:hypothetical protein
VLKQARYSATDRFICGLFNDAVSSSDCIASNDTIINELERMWKEAVVS